MLPWDDEGMTWVGRERGEKNPYHLVTVDQTDGRCTVDNLTEDTIAHPKSDHMGLAQASLPLRRGRARVGVESRAAYRMRLPPHPNLPPRWGEGA